MGSFGKTNYLAVRKFISDDFEINTEEESSRKTSYGLGLKINVTKTQKIILQISDNNINDDGFDGWRYSSADDQYRYFSLGYSVKFNK